MKTLSLKETKESARGGKWRAQVCGFQSSCPFHSSTQPLGKPSGEALWGLPGLEKKRLREDSGNIFWSMRRLNWRGYACSDLRTRLSIWPQAWLSIPQW